MKKVLVLCTGNSCRSQMAEGFLRNLGVDVKSAGVESHGLNPYAVHVMREVSIDISTNILASILASILTNALANILIENLENIWSNI